MMTTQPTDNTKFPVWVLNGRDANNWRANKQDKVRFAPWLIGTFDTRAEADACMKGVAAAIGGALTNVVFLGDDDARRIEARVTEQNKTRQVEA